MRTADETLRLGGESDAVPNARRWVAEALTGTEFEEILPDIELVVSELVTNALLYAGAPVTLRLDAEPPRLRVEVGDTSRVAPIRALARGDSMTGRGLALVSALARDWGVTPASDGKIVWCELSTEPATESDEDMDLDALLAAWDDDEPDATPRHTIELGDVPLDLLLAAKAHVDNLVREFTLAAKGAESGSSSAVPAQLADLIEAVVSRFAEARQAIKRQAIEAAARGDERTTLTLTLPVDAADAGERYLAALDEADAYARAARLLTLETPPQHRVFRRWYVESLVIQLRRAAAGLPPTRPVTFERRLLDELATVATAHRLADRAARLQTVTATLAAATTVEEVAEAVVSEGVAALGASGGALLLPSPDGRIEVCAAVGYGDELVARLGKQDTGAELPAAAAIRTGTPVWLESREERLARFPALDELEPASVAICAVPLVSLERAVGALRFSFDMPRLFDEDERRFVLTLAAQTAQAYDRAAALADARAANDKLAFLADASAALAGSLDYRATLRQVAELAVPRLADWCVIHVAEGDSISALAVHHRDPEQLALAEELQRRYPIDPAAETGVAKVVRTGTSEFLPELTEEMLLSVARDDDHVRIMRALAFRSAVVVPLAARDRVFGAITMFYAESGRRYDRADLATAEDLARAAALAIDNAHLYRDLSTRTP